MIELLSEKVKLSPEHKQVLQELTIRENSPGTILRDFAAFLDYFREGELSITGKHQLPLRALPEINARLTHPIQLGLKRPQQKSYPHIHGLYLLLRASGLTCVGGMGKTPVLFVDKAVDQVWADLNVTERYCILLETWLVRGRPEIIGESGWRLLLVPENFQKWESLFNKIPNKGLRVAGNREVESSFMYTPGWHNLALLELFGLLNVRHGSPEAGKGWRIERISRTPLGDALLTLLSSEFFEDLPHEPCDSEERSAIPLGVLQSVLQPYCPEWKNNLSVPQWRFREGTHIFKVSLGRIWRRIAIPADQTLDALAYVILNAVDFDHDHLFRFSYENRFGLQERFYHPDMEDGPWTDKVLVGDVPLRIGQTMGFLYDFGDYWEFDVTLERVDGDMQEKEAVILEAYGEPPEQYPSPEDW